MFSLPLRIALRYLFSKKSTNAITLINVVTMVGMFVMSAALIIVLSAFNGFEGLVISLYNTFNPELKVSLEEGKVFTLTEQQLNDLKGLSGVKKISLTLEENAALKYKDNDYIGIVKGVDEHYAEVTGIEQAIYRGDFELKEGTRNYAVLGSGVMGALRVVLSDQYTPITVYMPSRTKSSGSLLPNKAFNREKILPTGVFAIQQDFDTKYMFTSLEFVRGLLDYRNGEVSSVEISLNNEASVSAIREKLELLLGNGYKIQDRYQQNEFLYKVMETEKWAVYAILSFILIITAFNIIGSLSMVVLEKKGDITILKTMGATNKTIRNIFIWEGVLTSLIGSLSGILLAFIVCIIQIKYEVVPLPGSGTFVVDAFPIILKATDFLLVISTVVFISVVAALLPANRAAKQALVIGQE